MHISQIENLEEFYHNTFGMKYYSVGPLGSGPIETWQFTNDKYDQARLYLGNFFFTKEDAEHYLQYMLNYYAYGDTPSPSYDFKPTQTCIPSSVS